MTSFQFAVILIIFIVLLEISSFFLGYTIGRRKGAKEGIDYCFSRYEEAAKANLLKDKGETDAKKKERSK